MPACILPLLVMMPLLQATTLPLQAPCCPCQIAACDVWLFSWVNLLPGIAVVHGMDLLCIHCNKIPTDQSGRVCRRQDKKTAGRNAIIYLFRWQPPFA